MNIVELMDALHQKDAIIQKQSRRIKLLEDKFSNLSKKFFRLKYPSTLLSTRTYMRA